MKRLLRWLAGTLLGIVLLLVVAVLLLNTSMVQGRLVEEAVGVLKEKLQTEVKVGRFQVRLIGQDIRLEEVEIEENGVKYVSVDCFESIENWPQPQIAGAN